MPPHSVPPISTVRGGFWIVAVFVILLRIPFLNQAIQGDDLYYLASAQHAQVDPAHPNHASFLMMGDWVTMRGHPHPPLNAWVLAGLLALIGDIREVPFHAVYIAFSLIAAAGMWSLARRFTPRPLEATLLFCVTLPFVINGASLESDLPFLAFWMAAIAAFISAVEPVRPGPTSSRPLPMVVARLRESQPATEPRPQGAVELTPSRRGSASLLVLAAVALGLAAMTAFQAVVIVPILWLYLWQRNRKWKPAWFVSLTPILVIVGWQAFERLTSETLPAAVMAGYFKSYNLQSLTNKLSNAVALTAHAGWIVFPALAFSAFWSWPAALIGMAAGVFLDSHPVFWISLGAGACLLFAQIRSASNEFLSAWIVIFFAAALVLFFAGSARYLLPISAPVAILVSRRLPSKWLLAGAAAQLGVALALAIVNYQHWDAYREFARSLEPEIAHKRVWVNGEWGLRYYLESYGALPLPRGQAVQPGEIVVTSENSLPIPFTTGGGVLAPYKTMEVRSPIPLRIMGSGSNSAYSTAMLGLRPFGIASASMDRVRAEAVVARQPTLSYLPMNAPEAESQIVSGVYQLEANQWRWMGERAVVLLKPPQSPATVRAVFYIPDQAAARSVSVTVDGKQVAHGEYSGSGMHTLLSSGPVAVSGETATLAITVDKTFSVPGDHRQLGVILSEVGFR